MNLNIDLYIINLQDFIFSHEKNIQLYLEFYIIYNDLILRNELIYISNDDDFKFQMLHFYHDFSISNHLR